jgi:tetratricopeptide (TPR) repeat protein
VCEFFERTEDARWGEQGTLSTAAFMQRLGPELDNARAALEWATGDTGDLATAVGLAGASAEVFRQLGLSQAALGAMLALQPRIDAAVQPLRAALFWERLSTLGNVGRLPKAVVLDAASCAERIYRASGARRRLHQALIQSAWSLNQTHESSAAAAMLPEISSLEDPAWPPWLRGVRLGLQGFVYQNQDRFEEALAAFVEQEALLLPQPGEELVLLRCQANQCYALNLMQRYEEAAEIARGLIARKRGGHSGGMVYLTHNFVMALIFLGRIDEAWQAARQAMPGWRRDGLLSYASGTLAMLLAERGRWADAARLGGAAMAYQRRNDIEHYPGLKRASAHLRALLEAAPCQPDDIERWQREGLALDEAAIAATAAISLRDEEPALNAPGERQ